MSEEASKVTTVTKQPKPKDLRRIEAGKRLVAISRDAKARKKQERENIIKEEAKACNTEVILVGSLVAVSGLLYYFKYHNTTVESQSPAPAEPITINNLKEKRKMYSMDED